MFGKTHLKSPDAHKVKELRKWDARDKKRLLLIHTIRDSYVHTPLLMKPAGDVFKTWDVVSTSLIDAYLVAQKYNKIALTVHADSGLFFEAGFILDVPVQNILGTFSGDVWFPNHAGVVNGKTQNRFALADSIFAGRDKKNNIRFQNGYNQIFSPDKVLKKTNYQWHNEVLLIGRPNINTYQELPPTREIKIAGIILAPKVKVNTKSGHMHANKKLYALADKIIACNPGVPILDLSAQN